MARIGITCSSGMGNTQPIEKVGRLYIDGIVAAGGVPVVLPSLPRRFASEALDGLDGLLLTGGGDVDPARYGEHAVPECGRPDPARDGWELELIALARGDELPMLGICRGAQVLAVAFGGKLVQHLPDRGIEGHDDDRVAEEVHDVSIAPGTLAHRVLGTDRLRANTLHHQAIDPRAPGDGVVVTGLADDGVVEAIEVPGEPILGVQWHPELLLDQAVHRAPFDWLVAPDRIG